jgi:hypothetical protein
MNARTPMITETNRANLIGKTVVDEEGNFGTVRGSDDYNFGEVTFLLVVDFDNGWRSEYSRDGYLLYSINNDQYIKLV